MVDMPPKNLSNLKRNPVKQVVRSVLMVKQLNRIVTSTISCLPDNNWKQRIPVLNREGVFDLQDDGSIVMSNTDKCQVAQELFWNRGKLRLPADQYALKAAVIFARQSNTFLDIGAYSGLFALAAGRVNSSIESYAYEIFPENFLILYENVIRNNLIKQVKPRLCGVADKAGTMTIPIKTDLGLLPSSFAIDWEFKDGVDVPLMTLDELHENIEGAVTIKIDVEGFEAEVLEGGQMLLQRTRPDIICEILRRAPRIPDIEKQLRAMNYRFFHITNDGFVEYDAIVPTKHERDWLFTTRNDENLVKYGIKVVSANL